MSSESNPQRLDKGAHTQEKPVGASHGLVGDTNADLLKQAPPNNLGLADPREQDRSRDLVGVEGTEPVGDGQTEADKKKAEELAKKLNV
ncbi:hypothetical protein JCM10212_005642 [Sporobolomyces blumeae]